ncbi:MAG: hypothetical protein KF893_25655 [Caldilineaceae bacterium]|nr:hypothetical protein [Caldilineaceae bacterium]
MQTVTVPDSILDALDTLESGGTPEQKLTRLVQSELRRRLARYQLTDRLFRDKYGMTLEEFEAGERVAASGYTFEIESDHQDWDLAVDGIHTIQNQLARVQDLP